MLALAAYGEESDEGEGEGEGEENAAGRFAAQLRAVADESDSSEEGGGGGGGGGHLGGSGADREQPADNIPTHGLPSADDILEAATGLAPLPEQLHPARAAALELAAHDPPAQAAQPPRGPAGRGPDARRTAPAPQPPPKAAAKGAPPREAAKRAAERESVKARTEKKRKAGQSASFLGGAWKSQTEMHFRDNFDG